MMPCWLRLLVVGSVMGVVVAATVAGMKGDDAESVTNVVFACCSNVPQFSSYAEPDVVCPHCSTHTLLHKLWNVYCITGDDYMPYGWDSKTCQNLAEVDANVSACCRSMLSDVRLDGVRGTITNIGWNDLLFPQRSHHIGLEQHSISTFIGDACFTSQVTSDVAVTLSTMSTILEPNGRSRLTFLSSSAFLPVLNLRRLLEEVRKGSGVAALAEAGRESETSDDIEDVDDATHGDPLNISTNATVISDSYLMYNLLIASPTSSPLYIGDDVRALLQGNQDHDSTIDTFSRNPLTTSLFIRSQSHALDIHLLSTSKSVLLSLSNLDSLAKGSRLRVERLVPSDQYQLRTFVSGSQVARSNVAHAVHALALVEEAIVKEHYEGNLFAHTIDFAREGVSRQSVNGSGEAASHSIDLDSNDDIFDDDGAIVPVDKEWVFLDEETLYDTPYASVEKASPELHTPLVEIDDRLFGGKMFLNDRVFSALIIGDGNGDVIFSLAIQLLTVLESSVIESAALTYIDVSPTLVELVRERFNEAGITSDNTKLTVKFASIPSSDMVAAITSESSDLFNSDTSFHYIHCDSMLMTLDYDAQLSLLVALRSRIATSGGGMRVSFFSDISRFEYINARYTIANLLRGYANHAGNDVNDNAYLVEDAITIATSYIQTLPLHHPLKMRLKSFSRASIIHNILRPYNYHQTVADSFDLLEKSGLQVTGVRSLITYDIRSYTSDVGILSRIDSLSLPSKLLVAELLLQSFDRHVFYVAPIATSVQLRMLPVSLMSPSLHTPIIQSMIPVLFPGTDLKLFWKSLVELPPSDEYSIKCNSETSGFSTVVLPSLAPYILLEMDGYSSIKNIFNSIRQHYNSSLLLSDFADAFSKVFISLNKCDMLFLTENRAKYGDLWISGEEIREAKSSRTGSVRVEQSYKRRQQEKRRHKAIIDEYASRQHKQVLEGMQLLTEL